MAVYQFSFLTLRTSKRLNSSYHGSFSIEGEKPHQFFNRTISLNFSRNFPLTEIIFNVFSDLFFKLSALKLSRMPGRPSQKGGEEVGQVRIWQLIIPVINHAT